MKIYGGILSECYYVKEAHLKCYIQYDSNYMRLLKGRSMETVTKSVFAKG